MNPIIYHLNSSSSNQIGNYIFQLISNRKLSTILHSHDFFEILLLLRGQATHFINSRIYTMKAGDCVILVPGDSHNFSEQSEDLELLGISVAAKEFLQFSQGFEADIPACTEHLSTVITFSCLNQLSEIRSLSQKCYLHTNSIHELRLLLCTILSCYCIDKRSASSDIPALLQNALDQMHDLHNIKEGMAAMVRLTNYSRSHLCRLMKKYYQISPHDFIKDLRLKTSYNLVLFSDLSIDEIAESVGFDSTSHFNIIFKKEFGVSPAMLRKRNTARSF